MAAFGSGDAAGLFGDGAPSQAAPQSVGGAARQEKRIKLKNIDLVPSQVLNPSGVSDIDGMSLQDLWAATAKGNKWCEFHSELASQDNYRMGIGLSRFAEAVLAGIEKLSDPNVKAALKEDVWEKASEEAERMTPFLKALNAGKGSQQDNQREDAGFAAMRKRAKLSQPAHTEDAIRAAAIAVHAWLAADQSPLRAVLHILGAGGAFYVATVNEKVARAFVRARPATAATVAAAAVARGCQAAPAEQRAEDHTAGLF